VQKRDHPSHGDEGLSPDGEGELNNPMSPIGNVHFPEGYLAL
jgi:hypothetical protein